MFKEEDYVTLNFRIEYDSKGNEFGIIGSINEFGNWTEGKHLKLTWGPGNIWRARIRIPIVDDFVLEYKYVEIKEGRIVRWEDNQHKIKINTSFKRHDLLFMDRWLAKNSLDVVNQSSAFKVIRSRPNATTETQSTNLPPPSDTNFIIQFNLKHYNLKDYETLYICGSEYFLGNWKLHDSLRLDDSSFPDFHTSVHVPRNFNGTVEYKFVKASVQEPSLWENQTRKLNINKELSFYSHVFVDNYPFAGEKDWKGVGVAVPVFSLRSEESLGVGEFSDLKLFVDLAKRTGIKLIQILPVNDTNILQNWKDSYPYSTLSVFALHPIYVRIQDIGGVPKEILNKVADLKPQMDEKFVNYEEALRIKLELLSEIFESQKESFLENELFLEWFQLNKEWLSPYALFCSLRDKYKTCDYNTWDNYSSITAEQINELTSPTSDFYGSVTLNYFIQYHASKQLSEASDYAKKNGVAMKGDLPIGVDPLSCDTWINRHLFNMDCSTGAPPDAFAEEGQNWGFPTYNWDEMAKDDFSWWRNRLRVLSNYFHAFRIDHVLGFFRIWEIPRSCEGGLLGRFNPSFPISGYELEKEGVWDFERLTQPYTNWEELKSNFSESKCHQIVKDYFKEVTFLRYTFKNEFDTEKKILNFASKQEEENDVKKYLSRVFNNRVLIEDKNANNFHFRIDMQKTTSFQHLDHAWKEPLQRLYVDYFYKRQDLMWKEKALQKLPMMQNTTNMLVCGEDLGMIPGCVQNVLDDLSILGLRIQRMPKDPKEKLENPHHYPYLTVCSPSVHDTSTLRGWWDEDRHGAKLLGDMIGLEGNLPIECLPDVITKTLGLHFASPAILVVIAIQDFLGLDYDLRISNPEEERVNVPANRYHYWRYRLPLSLEKLLKNEEWLDNILNLIKNTGRF